MMDVGAGAPPVLTSLVPDHHANPAGRAGRRQSEDGCNCRNPALPTRGTWSYKRPVKALAVADWWMLDRPAPPPQRRPEPEAPEGPVGPNEFGPTNLVRHGARPAR